jgi:hypothetical protein
MEHYTNINAMVQAADLTLPPPEKEPDRQYYFIKKLQQHIFQYTAAVCSSQSIFFEFKSA